MSTLIVFLTGPNNKTSKQQDLINLLGAMYAVVLSLGALNASGMQFVVAIERTVFYRERATGIDRKSVV